MQLKSANRPAQSNSEKVEQEVFKNSFIPRTLDEVAHFERDVLKMAQGNADGVIF